MPNALVRAGCWDRWRKYLVRYVMLLCTRASTMCLMCLDVELERGGKVAYKGQPKCAWRRRQTKDGKHVVRLIQYKNIMVHVHVLRIPHL